MIVKRLAFFIIGWLVVQSASGAELILEVDYGRQAGKLQVVAKIVEMPRFLLRRGFKVTDSAGRPLSAGASPYEGMSEYTTPADGEIRYQIWFADVIAEQYGRQPRPEQPTFMLQAAAGWLPYAENVTSRLKVSASMPENWHSVSQGELIEDKVENGQRRQRWREDQPQDDIYLLFGPWRVYTEHRGETVYQAYLLEPDRRLAEKYLEAGARYVEQYSALLGDYPYAKFALVENHLPTGFGMPSFTLIGSQVIRLPFIIHTSYPHEVLHNWWGNGVYVDYREGIWSEGLTTYLADHLQKEQRGQGADYRRDALQKYSDYVGEHDDFALRSFLGKEDPATEAVGYGKTLMFFHMLRRELGDAHFLEGLRRFYREQRFRYAGYGQIQRTFEQVAGRKLGLQFHQWLSRPGALQLGLGQVRVNGQRISLELKQKQKGEPYRVKVPVAVTVAGRQQAELHWLAMSKKQQRFDIEVAAKPLRLDVDPEFDLFRRLAEDERPVSLARAYAAEATRVVSAAPQHWNGFATALFGPEVRIHSPDEAAAKGETVWLLGWDHPWRQRFLAAQPGVEVKGESLLIDGRPWPRAGHSLVLTAEVDGATWVWLAADGQAALPGLARKLPHYGKYSYLVFEGAEPANRIKGHWPVTAAHLSHALVAGSRAQPLAPRPALGDLSEP